MSFDLYVWGSPQTATAEQAERICHELAAENTSSVSADARVQGFAQELLRRFPALESLTDAELEASPWSMTPEISASHVIMTISWSRAQELAEFVLALAARRGLVCFDPQASVVHNPPGQALAGGLRLEFCDGGVVDRPEPAALGVLLQALSPRNWYVCLESRPGWFVQVGIGPNAGNVPAGKFALEHREGTPERHHRALVASRDEVVAAFEGFASGNPVWKDSFSWSHL
ncbi:MAG: hypothetical protein JWN52_3471 [Actinomycetia bacterium]|nr:hypothetical protein [Actinomycetes bacterium]